ncbi:MAG: Crp/Fnr family transcriptional regulator, partial [Treponema sp.]|nr:Crp/Fnr family transcriptional regulator [Treponema sp.]
VLITGNPQIALILLKLFCKRIYSQRRRFGILCIEDLHARLADVFLMYDDIQMMEEKIAPTGQRRRFPLTINDVAHWAGIGIDEAKDELSKYSAKKRIEMYDDYMIVQNIQEMKRTVDAYFSTHNKTSGIRK